jgi:hypothetical protein
MSIDTSALGALKRSFGIPLGSAVFVLMFGFVMMLMPIVGLVEKWWDFHFLVFFIFGLGGVLVFASINGIYYRVSVFDRGFAIRSLIRPQVCLWSQVKVIREVYSNDYVKVPGALVSVGLIRDFEVERDDGKVFYFKANSVVNGMLLCEYFRAIYRENKIPWEQVHRPFG